MKNNVVALIICLVTLNARAEVIAALGANNVFEREAYATQYANRTPLAMRVGYQEFSNAMIAEFNQFKVSDSISQLQITRTQFEFLLWGRHSFNSENVFQYYVQFAPGLQLAHIQTDFMTSTQEDTSRTYLALAGATGVALQYEGFRFEVEFRALTSQIAAPNPTYSVGFYGGYLF